MKAVIQRVKDASVTVDGQVVGKISSGLLVYYGVDVGDKLSYCGKFCDKILKLRIFLDENGKMNKSLLDLNLELLLISQFTLSANVYAGNRPSFDTAAPPEFAVSCYEKMIEELEKRNVKYQTGRFGLHMDVRYLNDGPITFLLDSDKMKFNGNI